MTDDLLYKVRISVEDGADISEIEDSLQNLLMDLYNNDNIEEIMVRDKTPPIDEDVDEMIDVIDRLESSDVQKAMELVTKLSDINNS